jgi:hypothetical protein
MHRNEIKIWAADTAAEPTWRDGLGGSDRTYMIVAVPRTSRNGYQAIVYGRFGGTSGKVKFYPNPEALGLDRRVLMNSGFHSVLDRPGEPYTRFVCTLQQLKTLLAGLDPEQWVVPPMEGLYTALTEQLGRSTSRQRAPEDHQFEGLKPEDVKDTGGLDSVELQDQQAQFKKFSPA